MDSLTSSQDGMWEQLRKNATHYKTVFKEKNIGYVSINDENQEPIPLGHIAIWNFKTNEISHSVKISRKYGNIFAINDEKCWDIYEYPKIIDLKSGEINDKLNEVFFWKTSLVYNSSFGRLTANYFQ